jgi:hypothetical protein
VSVCVQVIFRYKFCNVNFLIKCFRLFAHLCVLCWGSNMDQELCYNKQILQLTEGEREVLLQN